MDIKQDVRIKLESSQVEDLTLSELLANRLGLPRPSRSVDDAPCYFVYRNKQLLLFIKNSSEVSSPLSVDFLSGAVFYRYLKDRRINQPLAKATGIKRGTRPSVCDVTAGLGGDSFVLAALGCQVTMIERSALVWALLEDGISRALLHPDIGRIFRDRVSLHFHDAISFITSSEQIFDTIYMDPMYPQQKKTALNKREMRFLRLLVGSDEDSIDLLQAARHKARSRVVVKRPATAKFLEKPSYSIKGKSSRFDVYLTPRS